MPHTDGPSGEERAGQAQDAGDVGKAAASSDPPRHGVLRLLRQAEPEEVRFLRDFIRACTHPMQLLLCGSRFSLYFSFVSCFFVFFAGTTTVNTPQRRPTS